MKVFFILQVACSFLFYSCKSQNQESNIDYLKVLKEEISGNKFHEKYFNISVKFKMNEKILKFESVAAIEAEWNKVEVIFKNSDYMLNYCDKESKTKKCIEIKNHYSIYLVRINEEGKIYFIEKVKINLLHNAPTNNL